MAKFAITIDEKHRLKISLANGATNIGYIDIALDYMSDVECPEDYAPGEAMIIYLRVEERHQRKGYGSMLVRHAMQVLKERAYKKLHVEDITGHNFYMKLGFKFRTYYKADSLGYGFRELVL